MKKFEKFFPAISVIILFSLPFFWYPVGSQDLGGDSTRLYFYEPFLWLKNIGLFLTNPINSLGPSLSNLSLIPFLGLLSLLKVLVLNNTYVLNSAFSGFILSGGFLFTYLFYKEIFDSEEYSGRKIGAFFGSLLSLLSPLVIFDWYKALYSINQVFIYPFVAYMFIRYIKTDKYKYLIIANILIFIFSVNFSLVTFPWFISFFSFLFLLFFLYSVINRKISTYIKGIFIFGLLFFLIQSYQLIPQVIDLFGTDSLTGGPVLSKEYGYEKGLEYFLSVQDYVRLTYNLLGQSQFNLPKGNGAFDFGLKYRYLFYVYILVISFVGVIIGRKNLKEKKTFAALFFIFIILAFLITSRITSYSLPIYKSFFNIPAFSMYRSFYIKFAFAFIFFYALLFGYSLNYFLDFLRFRLLKILVILPLSALLIFNSWPLLSGMIVNTYIWQSKDIKPILEITDDFKNVYRQIQKRDLSAKFLDLPLTNEEYQLWSGKNGGAYMSTSAIAILAGRNDFAGLGSFGPFQSQISKIIEEKNWPLFDKYLSALNIRYIFYNSDEYIYNGFPSYPYPTVFKLAFPYQKSIKKFLETDISASRVESIAQYSLWLRKGEFLPLFYVPIDVYEAGRETEIISDIYSLPGYKSRSAIFFNNQNLADNKILRKYQLMRENSEGEPFVLTREFDKSSIPTIEYQKINPSKYLIRIHGASENFPLVFLNKFQDYWRMVIKANKNVIKQKVDDRKLEDYSVTKENEADQATLTEVVSYIKSGLISTILPCNSSIFNKNSNVKFISKIYNGTIENNNLNCGFKFFDLFQKRFKLNNHLKANGYANSWIIPVKELCSEKKLCNENGGKYDFELELEYWPQKIFYYFFFVAGLTFVTLFFYLLNELRRKKKNEEV